MDKGLYKVPEYFDASLPNDVLASFESDDENINKSEVWTKSGLCTIREKRENWCGRNRQRFGRKLV
jgi:hypothetical protein